MSNDRRCTAHARGTGRQCRAWAVRGERVCQVHGAGGGRPIIHGRYSKALGIVGQAWRREMLARVSAILRIGGDVRGDLTLLEAFLDPPDQCRARSKQTGQRCQRRPTRGFLVCYYHGSRGGRRRKDGLGTFGRVEALLKDLDRQRARLQWRRLVALVDCLPVQPEATRDELESALMIREVLQAQKSGSASEAVPLVGVSQSLTHEHDLTNLTLTPRRRLVSVSGAVVVSSVVGLSRRPGQEPALRTGVQGRPVSSWGGWAGWSGLPMMTEVARWRTCRCAPSSLRRTVRVWRPPCSVDRRKPRSWTRFVSVRGLRPIPPRSGLRHGLRRCASSVGIRAR